MSIAAVMAAINEAVDALDEVRAYDALGAVVDPPAFLLGPPTLSYDVSSFSPSTASLTGTLAVTADDRALEAIFELLPLVVEAVESVVAAVVTTATPGTLSIGSGSDLPAYLLQIEVAL